MGTISNGFDFFPKLDNLCGFKNFGDKKFGMKIHTSLIFGCSLWENVCETKYFYRKTTTIVAFNIIYSQSWKWSYTYIIILKLKIFASIKIRVYVEYNGQASRIFCQVSRILLIGFNEVSRYFWSTSINFPTIFNKTINHSTMLLHFFLSKSKDKFFLKKISMKSQAT